MRAWVPYTSLEEAYARVGRHEGVELTTLDDSAGLAATAPEVELVALPNFTATQVWGELERLDKPALRVVQLGSAGYEHMLGLVPDAVSIANAAGVHDAGTAELAVALALANLRGLDTFARQQQTHTWKHSFGTSLADKRVLIYGYGHIGAAVERRVTGFDPAEVVRVARSARTEPVVHAAGDLPDLLPEADVVFITAPATHDTVGAFDARTLSLLHDGALVVNVGRGKIMDTDAVIAEAGRLRFALDVVEPEPLPADSPLWDAPGVTIAPHVGGANDSAPVRYDRLIARQLAHLAAGERFENIVWGPLA
ncbi:MAG TPA: NAD(P)-dependent oxidoreductase [Propionibacteriaceae bacterium]|nr:NAD(P)-dependent oxidoreductase [Propionibacteriaceae bacterium]